MPQKQQPRDRLWLNDGSCIHCARRIGLIQVIEQLVHAMILHGIPQYIRSDNGPEFIAKELRSWLQGVGVKTAYIEPGSPWENGYCESFNGTFRDELLDGKTLTSSGTKLTAVQLSMVIRAWIDRAAIADVLVLSHDQQVLLSQTVEYPRGH